MALLQILTPHCCGIAKLKNDPGLCQLSGRALQGYLAELSLENTKQAHLPELNQQILSSKVIRQCVDWLLSTYNPDQPDNGTCISAKLEFEPINSKDKKTYYKAKITTKKNDSGLNNDHHLKLQGWGANVTFREQLIIMHVLNT